MPRKICMDIWVVGMDGIICVHEPGGRIFKKVFINFLSSSLVVALVPDNQIISTYTRSTFGPRNGQHMSNLVGYWSQKWSKQIKKTVFPEMTQKGLEMVPIASGGPGNRIL